ncbi:hypothetical protein EOL05_25555, partial [Escherichia coli]
GMVAEGILLEGKEWLITRCEKIYFDNLEKWFGHYCHIHCHAIINSKETLSFFFAKLGLFWKVDQAPQRD